MQTGETIYRSKQGIISYIPITILVVVLAIDAYSGAYLNGLIVTAVVAIVVIPMLLNTRYTITPDARLNIRCGWFVNITMDIKAISKVSDTRSILSSPALSLDRIEIFYNKFDSVMVSPRDKEAFIANLQTFNPTIDYLNK